jgi:hypothetical protein
LVAKLEVTCCQQASDYTPLPALFKGSPPSLAEAAVASFSIGIRTKRFVDAAQCRQDLAELIGI